MASREQTKISSRSVDRPCHDAALSISISENPDHSAHIKRLNRVKGQLEGIQNMIERRRYCPEIIQQLKAARAGLKAIEAEIFETHLVGCVREAFSSSEVAKAENKIDEIMKMIF